MANGSFTGSEEFAYDLGGNTLITPDSANVCVYNKLVSWGKNDGSYYIRLDEGGPGDTPWVSFPAVLNATYEACYAIKQWQPNNRTFDNFVLEFKKTNDTTKYYGNVSVVSD